MAQRFLSLRHPRVPLGRVSTLSRAFHIGLVPEAKGSKTVVAQREQLRTSGVEHLQLKTPVFQVFGSNTDVGKTIISAGICRAAVRTSQRVAYIKPLQTGTADVGFIGDAGFVQRHTAAVKKNTDELLSCETLFSWKTPVSPHLAAAKEDHAITDAQVLEALTTRLNQANDTSNPYSLLLVETAGGVCSPSASMLFQADVYRSLRLPVVLVGDGKLGGISGTISALESLLIRGYDVAAICLIEQDGLDNAEAIEPKTKELGIPVFTMNAVPPQPEPLDDWFNQQDSVFDQVVQRLQSFHNTRLQSFKDMQERAENVFWWPFTQHKKYGGLSVIDSAHGDEFATFNSSKQAIEPMFDACASWWTQGIGHGNGKMATALAYTAGRYGHVMFPENAHEPAFRLSEKLLETVGKDWASRVYFSDDGSTAVEVALKMAFRKYIVDHGLDYSATSSSQSTSQEKKKLVTLAQANCYHGDTLGVMNIAEPSVFNEKQHPWYFPEAAFLKTPSVALRDGRYVISLDPEISDVDTSSGSLASLNDVFDLASRLSSPLAETYRGYVNDVIARTEGETSAVGTLLIEPILIGSGGMVLVDPLFQRIAVEECRKRKIPVIFDEVFSGWWRLGVESGRDLLGVNPDISCYAKLLTGGVVPLAVTLASEEIFNTFYADDKGDALLHGHSFTAHPVGCAAALTALDMYDVAQRAQTESSVDVTRSYWDTDRVAALSRQSYIARAFDIGTVLCVELESSNAGYASSEAQALIRVLRANHVYARALGNVVYFMCSPLTSQADCGRYLDVLERHLGELYEHK
ncbi:hypothetical protein Poli38472_014036 [Pythium oligandrum]|uniref:Dethiobiotin synthase n=1 Tax=Pythium oligandrum TaxID=41045 RepID=A0A8K1CP85_PYTOL|nr:hypothetical protein Poli38472_014036 [Pythium oligandrum]|eukprot:TMW66724.1 hypothetical protein Poli38472_014036 [Pythium oligandrum]